MRESHVGSGDGESGGAAVSGPHVELGMYPFESFAWAWDELWSAVTDRVAWAPGPLTRSGDLHARWRDDACLVTHVCGAPLVVEHRDDLRVVGAFSLDVPDATPDAHYRTLLLSPHDRSIDALAAPGIRAVVNSADSLSGWISLLAATVGAGGTWPGDVEFTGSHVASVHSLARGEADIASIDPWSFALMAAENPDLVGGLHVVGTGPLVPTPAVAARHTCTESQVAELRDAFDDATSDPALGAALTALRITGFVRLTLDDYLTGMPPGFDRN